MGDWGRHPTLTPDFHTRVHIHMNIHTYTQLCEHTHTYTHEIKKLFPTKKPNFISSVPASTKSSSLAPIASAWFKKKILPAVITSNKDVRDCKDNLKGPPWLKLLPCHTSPACRPLDGLLLETSKACITQRTSSELLNWPPSPSQVPVHYQ